MKHKRFAPKAAAAALNEPEPDELVIDTNWMCDCPFCVTGRLIHWRCDGCGGGPFRFSFSDPAGAPVKRPYGQRQYNLSNGLVGGIRRWCSAACAMNEEKVYLMDQLEKAHVRRDTNAVRVFTGRLHELSQAAQPEITSITERMQRRDAPVTEPAPEPTE